MRDVRYPLAAADLTWDRAKQLADSLSEADIAEAQLQGATPRQALSSGVLLGFSKCAIRMDGSVAGAWGYTEHGTIWSLWGDLSREEAFQVIRALPAWVEVMIRMSKRRTLHNWIDTRNKRALRWLQMAKIFTIIPMAERAAHYFETKPLPWEPA